MCGFDRGKRSRGALQRAILVDDDNVSQPGVDMLAVERESSGLEGGDHSWTDVVVEPVARSVPPHDVAIAIQLEWHGAESWKASRVSRAESVVDEIDQELEGGLDQRAAECARDEAQRTTAPHQVHWQQVDPTLAGTRRIRQFQRIRERDSLDEDPITQATDSIVFVPVTAFPSPSTTIT